MDQMHLVNRGFEEDARQQMAARKELKRQFPAWHIDPYIGYMVRLSHEPDELARLEKTYPLVGNGTLSLVVVNSNTPLIVSIGFTRQTAGETMFETWTSPAGVSTRIFSIPLHLIANAHPWLRTRPVGSQRQDHEVYARLEPVRAPTPRKDGDMPIDETVQSFFGTEFKVYMAGDGSVLEEVEDAMTDGWTNPFDHDSEWHGISRMWFQPTDRPVSNDWRQARLINTTLLDCCTPFTHIDGLIIKSSAPVTCELKTLDNGQPFVFDTWVAPAGVSFYTCSLPRRKFCHSTLDLCSTPVDESSDCITIAWAIGHVAQSPPTLHYTIGEGFTNSVGRPFTANQGCIMVECERSLKKFRIKKA
mgnify:CR=1 FL=1